MLNAKIQETTEELAKVRIEEPEKTKKIERLESKLDILKKCYNCQKELKKDQDFFCSERCKRELKSYEI